MKSRGTTIWKELKHRLLNTWGSYLGLIVFLTVFRILPLRIGRFIARVSGIIWFWLDGMHRRIGLENLALAFPEKSEAERRAILRASCSHLATCAVEMCQFLSMRREDVCGKWVVVEDGSEACAQAAAALGKGVIGASGHIGSWELSGFVFPAMGYPSVCIARRVRAPLVDAELNRIRMLLGNVIIQQEGALRHILRAMKEQKFVGVIMDLYAGSKNPQVRMFGHETSTVDTVARLHLKTGAPIVTNLMMRRPDGRYLWRCRRVEIPALRPGEDSDAHVRAILESCNQAFEQTIREFPEQWLWMHRRWRQSKNVSLAISETQPEPAAQVSES